MRKWVDRVLGELGYIRIKQPLPPGYKVLNFTDRDLAKAAIFKTLTSVTEPQNSTHAEFFADVSHRILAELEKSKSMSLHDQLREYHPDMLAERMITYVLACGIACHWEMDVKNFSEKLGVKVFSDEVFKKQKSPGFKRLEDIVDALKKKVPKLELNLTRTMGLRDALIHGNFHQLKTYASECQKKEVRDSFQGKVWKVSLGQTKADPIALNEVKELEEVKKHGSFSWFLETSTSALFETVILEFKERVDDLNLLKALHALSFEETSWAFNHICIEGKRLTDAEITQFMTARKSSFSSQKESDRLLDRIQSLIK